MHRLADDTHHSSGPSAEAFLRVRAAVGRALGVGVFDAVDGDPERRAVVGLGRAAGELLATGCDDGKRRLIRPGAGAVVRAAASFGARSSRPREGE